MSVWRVEVGSSARRAMQNLSTVCRREAADVLIALEEDGPSAFPDSELRDFADHHRVRICGSHRLIFRVSRSRNERRILVTRIEPRSRVYRGYER
jgi:mRNA-degrading endonuclease RelE of RelBE toxin-antitoxin system